MAQAYKVDFTTRTITITAEFEKAMSNPEAAEYKIIRQLCADFPGMRIVKRTHRTPTHYTSKNGEKSACNPYKNLTYAKSKSSSSPPTSIFSLMFFPSLTTLAATLLLTVARFPISSHSSLASSLLMFPPFSAAPLLQGSRFLPFSRLL